MSAAVKLQRSLLPTSMTALVVMSLLESVAAVQQLASHLAVAESSDARRDLLTAREPIWRISMQPLSDGDVEPLVMNHLAKCGGSFVKRVLFEAVPGPLRIENEAVSLSKRDVANRNFIIGLIRNPFDYYVSLWAFTSTPRTCCFKQALTSNEREETLGRDHPLGSSEDDRARFRKWLRTVNARELGVLSLRFYGSYLRQSPDLPFSWHSHTANAPSMREHAALISDAIGNFSEASPVSCWVHSEQLEADLRGCLVQYETEVGQPVVNWASFNRSVGTKEDTNDSEHVPCEEMYDEESRKFVEQGDLKLLEAFGYPRRCQLREA